MAESAGFSILRLQLGIRFVQGYRYLDRCGEALIRLENSLAEGWIPAEATPTAGALKNAVLGMDVTFNSLGLGILQTDFISQVYEGI